MIRTVWNISKQKESIVTHKRKLILPLGALFAALALAAVVMLVRASADDLLHQSARLLADATDGHARLNIDFKTPDTREKWQRRGCGVGPQSKL